MRIPAESLDTKLICLYNSFTHKNIEIYRLFLLYLERILVNRFTKIFVV
jgi:hypothetical protein